MLAYVLLHFGPFSWVNFRMCCGVIWQSGRLARSVKYTGKGLAFLFVKERCIKGAVSFTSRFQSSFGWWRWLLIYCFLTLNVQSTAGIIYQGKTQDIKSRVKVTLRRVGKKWSWMKPLPKSNKLKRQNSQQHAKLNSGLLQTRRQNSWQHAKLYSALLQA